MAKSFLALGTVIRVENLGKQYQRGAVGTGTLSHDLNRWWHRLRGKPDPYLSVDEVHAPQASPYVWALRHVSFEVQQGEVLGIVGANGAGKSTLLKILSRVTQPTTGRVQVRGRVASLLEVGTGFHPELTGRENIYVNGTILGMRKAEITRKFDEIVDFAGVEPYIDTPVKRYSSGMYMRLAFAVAAHLEPEILVLDEVLAVGDAEFQKKCLGKMEDVSRNQGRTVLLVSHQLGYVVQLCQRAILLNRGRLMASGPCAEVVAQYMAAHNQHMSEYTFRPQADDVAGRPLYFAQVRTVNEQGLATDKFGFHEAIGVEMQVNIPRYDPRTEVSVTLMDKYGAHLMTVHEPVSKFYTGESTVQLRFWFPSRFIAPNFYRLRVSLFIVRGEMYHLAENICPFRVSDTGTGSSLAAYEGADYGFVIPPNTRWEKLG